jgi:hypothetical protein
MKRLRLAVKFGMRRRAEGPRKSVKKNYWWCDLEVGIAGRRRIGVRKAGKGTGE